MGAMKAILLSFMVVTHESTSLTNNLLFYNELSTYSPLALFYHSNSSSTIFSSTAQPEESPLDIILESSSLNPAEKFFFSSLTHSLRPYITKKSCSTPLWHSLTKEKENNYKGKRKVKENRISLSMTKPCLFSSSLPWIIHSLIPERPFPPFCPHTCLPPNASKTSSHNASNEKKHKSPYRIFFLTLSPISLILFFLISPLCTYIFKKIKPSYLTRDALLRKNVTGVEPEKLRTDLCKTLLRQRPYAGAWISTLLHILLEYLSSVITLYTQHLYQSFATKAHHEYLSKMLNEEKQKVITQTNKLEEITDLFTDMMIVHKENLKTMRLAEQERTMFKDVMERLYSDLEAATKKMKQKEEELDTIHKNFTASISKTHAEAEDFIRQFDSLHEREERIDLEEFDIIRRTTELNMKEDAYEVKSRELNRRYQVLEFSTNQIDQINLSQEELISYYQEKIEAVEEEERNLIAEYETLTMATQIQILWSRELNSREKMLKERENTLIKYEAILNNKKDALLKRVLEHKDEMNLEKKELNMQREFFQTEREKLVSFTRFVLAKKVEEITEYRESILKFPFIDLPGNSWYNLTKTSQGSVEAMLNGESFREVKSTTDYEIKSSVEIERAFEDLNCYFLKKIETLRKELAMIDDVAARHNDKEAGSNQRECYKEDRLEQGHLEAESNCHTDLSNRKSVSGDRVDKAGIRTEKDVIRDIVSTEFLLKKIQTICDFIFSLGESKTDEKKYRFCLNIIRLFKSRYSKPVIIKPPSSTESSIRSSTLRSKNSLNKQSPTLCEKRRESLLLDLSLSESHFSEALLQQEMTKDEIEQRNSPQITPTNESEQENTECSVRTKTDKDDIARRYLQYFELRSGTSNEVLSDCSSLAISEDELGSDASIHRSVQANSNSQGSKESRSNAKQKMNSVKSCIPSFAEESDNLSLPSFLLRPYTIRLENKSKLLSSPRSISSSFSSELVPFRRLSINKSLDSNMQYYLDMKIDYRESSLDTSSMIDAIPNQISQVEPVHLPTNLPSQNYSLETSLSPSHSSPIPLVHDVALFSISSEDSE